VDDNTAGDGLDRAEVTPGAVSLDAGSRADRVVTTGFLVSGFALVVFVVFGFSLALSLAVGWASLLGAAVYLERTAPPETKARFHAVLRAGVLAGLTATVAYDLSRWLLVEIGHMSVSPFGAWGAFGAALIPGSGGGGAKVLGASYHLVNGVSFGVAYAGLFGRRGVIAGILFGLGLEAVMLALYPGWLDIRSMREFTQMSLLGHVVYGAVLGGMTKHLLRPANARAPT